jgi:hypothetical protein
MDPITCTLWIDRRSRRFAVLHLIDITQLRMVSTLEEVHGF